MKAKLNIFCMLIFAVLVLDLAMATNTFVSGFKSGYDTAELQQEDKAEGVDAYRVVSLIPNEITHRNAITLTDSVTKKTYEAWPSQLYLPAEETDGNLGRVLSVILGLTVGVLGIISLVAFIRFMLNVNRSNIFTKKNTRHLKRLGWCMIVIGILSTFKYCNDVYAVAQTFSFTGYTVTYYEAVYSGTILFGLFTLVMAESFSLGLKLKEEQELTI